MRASYLLGALGVAMISFAASGTVNIQTVPVGNLGNAGVSQSQGTFGAVGYAYGISRFEITAGQYTEFLNAVASADPYALYNTAMNTNAQGCKIVRSGVSGSFTYTVAPDYADRPVNYIKFGAALRFANWMHNGQPVGALTGNAALDAGLTETGSYGINGATTAAALNLVTRSPGATWVVPSIDEWYKAAFHKNDGATGNYFTYGTSSDVLPGRDLTEATNPGNNANYTGSPQPIDGIYFTTRVGEFQLTTSPYGAYDMSGNVSEWTEAIASTSNRYTIGGGFSNAATSLVRQSLSSQSAGPTTAQPFIGFRLALVPTPGASLVLALGGLVGARRRRTESR